MDYEWGEIEDYVCGEAVYYVRYTKRVTPPPTAITSTANAPPPPPTTTTTTKHF